MSLFFFSRLQTGLLKILASIKMEETDIHSDLQGYYLDALTYLWYLSFTCQLVVAER